MRLRLAPVDTAPLRESPAFRRLWASTGVSLLGGQVAAMAVLLQAWQLSGSSVAVGAVGLAQAAPMAVFALGGGALADTRDRRALVLAATAGRLLASVLLAAQAFTGSASLAALLALAALQAACGGCDAPARRALVASLLPRRRIGAGLALTHLAFQAAMLLGPALGGAIAARAGAGACYVFTAAACAAALYGIARLPAAPGPAPGGRPGLRTIREGLGFIRRTPAVRGALWTDALATVTAMPVALFPAINEERFGGDPRTLGLFLSAIAVGGIAAGLLSGAAARSRRPGALMLTSAGAWGLGIIGFGLAQPLWLLLGCLAAAGAADTVSVIARGALVQLATPDSHRGRVGSVEYVLGACGPDLGNFRGGAVAGMVSAPFAAVSGGVLCVLGVAAIAAGSPALRRFQAPR